MKEGKGAGEDGEAEEEITFFGHFFCFKLSLFLKVFVCVCVCVCERLKSLELVRL